MAVASEAVLVSNPASWPLFWTGNSPTSGLAVNSPSPATLKQKELVGSTGSMSQSIKKHQATEAAKLLWRIWWGCGPGPNHNRSNRDVNSAVYIRKGHEVSALLIFGDFDFSLLFFVWRISARRLCTCLVGRNCELWLPVVTKVISQNLIALTLPLQYDYEAHHRNLKLPGPVANPKDRLLDGNLAQTSTSSAAELTRSLALRSSAGSVVPVCLLARQSYQGSWWIRASWHHLIIYHTYDSCNFNTRSNGFQNPKSTACLLSLGLHGCSLAKLTLQEGIDDFPDLSPQNLNRTDHWSNQHISGDRGSSFWKHDFCSLRQRAFICIVQCRFHLQVDATTSFGGCAYKDLFIQSLWRYACVIWNVNM